MKEQDSKDIKSSVHEDAPVYASREALEEARLKEAINRTPTEKFYFLMTLMKINRHMRKATIHHK
jgi:hypothetical protein